ncbi:MAG TPA: GntR family transcriptional regulator [Roseovarius sp.]|jgi:GntR family histidine utilization transcriptional repressor|nr:GntR family transcriptional regulator [Roseovarius sp.]
MSAPDKGSDRQGWRALREIIHERILSGAYPPGARLPRDADLAEQLGCARATVQRAMRALADDGLIERKRKGGSRVLARPVTRATFDIPVAREEVEATGRAYGYQLVAREIVQTPHSITAAMGLAAPEQMLRAQALHLADRRPFMYEDRWISLATVPEIVDVDLTRESANEWLLAHRPYSRCTLRFSAANATDAQAELLGTRAGDALFVIERGTWLGIAPITCVTALAPPGYALSTEA